ncbi:MAG: hypothetical protein EBU03_02740 [Methylophilaceae bacterium]|nr:hypothetical protein [Methylophilaceae bacterium]
MANKIYYLEPDEEITKVIDRIRKSEESGVVFVVSRGSTIAQSIINLKLLSRNAAEHGKTIGIVSTDRVTKNLAERLKIPVFAKAAEAEHAELTPALLKSVEKAPEVDTTPVKVNTYRKYDSINIF